MKYAIRLDFLGLLTMTFMVLKITHVIGWSWWWITCPLWLPLAFSLALILVLGILQVAAELCGD